MNTDTDYLKSIAAEIAEQQITDTKPNHHLLNEAKRLEKAIIHSLNTIENFTQRDTFRFNTLNKLVHICDMLYATTNSLNSNVQVITELLTAVKEVVPDEIRPNLRLPIAFVTLQKDRLNRYWETQDSLMEGFEISSKLIEIAGIPFKRFIDGKEKLTWGDFTWLKGYMAKLDIMDWDNADCSSKTEALLSLLIGRDFNHDRFYVYCKKYIENRIAEVKGKRNRVMEMVRCEKLVLQDTQPGTASFDTRACPVSTRLIKWIKEEIDFIETYERESPYIKLNFNWYKYTVAFFFKLLHEQHVFGDISFRELSEQIASTSTAMGADIPADSIIKKAYPKKQVDFKQMETLLVAMLEYIRRFI